MANVVVVLDEDAERRAAYVTAVRARISPVPGLVAGECKGEGWTAVWAAAPTAPVSWTTDATGGAVVWGEAIDEAGQRQTAAGVRAAWRENAAATWDGYYAAAAVEGAGRLRVGADVLGIFPLYYWQGPGVVLVGTSAELFAAHPAFRARLDMAGLVGILLTNGLVGGTTLWTGVRRLGAGHQLRVRDGTLATIETYRVPEGRRAVELPLAGHVALLGDALTAAVRRHAPPGPDYGLLLSGGLDSRMLAGFLIRAGVTPRAFTVGLSKDLEMRCATAAAGALNLDQVVGEPGPTGYPAYAALQARWEHLANGFNTIRDWWTGDQVRRVGDRLVTGGLADAVVGGVAISWAYSEPPPSMTYDAFVAQMPMLGLPTDVLRQLLKPEHAPLLEETHERLRREFHERGELGSDRAWRHDLEYGQRFHVGGTPWRLSFGTWPVLPMLDRGVLQAASSIPACSLADRTVQLALVRTHLPELASVPLDRSDILAHEPQYLTPRLRHLASNAARAQIRDLRRILPWRGADEESRYWYRINNFNSEAWRLVRAAAEPSRELAEDVFDRDVLATLLPPPEQPARSHGPGVSESGRKLLVGYLLWAGMHL